MALAAAASSDCCSGEDGDGHVVVVSLVVDAEVARAMPTTAVSSVDSRVIIVPLKVMIGCFLGPLGTESTIRDGTPGRVLLVRGLGFHTSAHAANRNDGGYNGNQRISTSSLGGSLKLKV